MTAGGSSKKVMRLLVQIHLIEDVQKTAIKLHTLLSHSPGVDPERVRGAWMGLGVNPKTEFENSVSSIWKPKLDLL